MNAIATSTRRTFRDATVADVPRLCEMFEHFRVNSPYVKYGPAHPDVSSKLIEWLIASDTSAVLVMERDGRPDGMIGLMVSGHPMTGERMATEMFWWVEPDCRGGGVQLLRRAERWAVERGAIRLLMVSPAQSHDVDRIYEALGFEPVETSWQKPLDWFEQRKPRSSRLPHGIRVHDDVLPDPMAYRAMALQQRFQAVHDGAVVFEAIAPCADPALPMWIVRQYPQLTPTLSFFRQGAQDQAEPHYIHTDASMGDWTGILYLNPDPPPGDGTAFWRSKDTGWVKGFAVDNCEAQHWFNDTKWDRWQLVEAQFNRLVLFPAVFYHSRAIRENYGTGDAARLIHVCFGTGRLS